MFKKGLVILLTTIAYATLWYVLYSNAQTNQSSCFISENYREAVDENILNMIRLLEMSGRSMSPLDDPDEAILFYAMLSSSRRYHQEIHSGLPACAHDFNREYVAMLGALEDVLAIKLASAAIPDNRRQES